MIPRDHWIEAEQRQVIEAFAREYPLEGCRRLTSMMLERYHRILKEQAIRPKTSRCLENARRVLAHFIEHYNTTRLHSAIGYIAPADHHTDIFAARDKKLATARKNRKN